MVNETETLPEPQFDAHRKSRVPLVWLVPLIAAIAGGWVAVRAIVDHGPTITLTFADADGIESGKTKVRYKNVDIGDVRAVTLSPDHRTVGVTVDMAKFAEPFLVRDTRFWVVRPRLGASGVSGLGTLLSGAYIGIDVGSSTENAKSFVGLETPPVVSGDASGKEFVLDSADAGSLSIGAPAYFHHIDVGQITALALNPDGRGITLKVFVRAPYDRFVTDDTRFWQASGVDVALDAGGIRMRTESLTTILAGGVAFESPTGSLSTVPAPVQAHFRLAPSRADAMKTPDRTVETYVLYFDESLRGLSPGAVVDFRGVEIGEVTSLNIEYDRANEKFLFPVMINVYPDRVQSRYLAGADKPQQEAHSLVSHMIEHGFRAQLRTGSLLTGQLYIALDFFPTATPIKAEPTLNPMPLPTIPGNLEQLQNTIVSVARKLDQLPLDRISQHADSAIQSLTRTLDDTDRLVVKVNEDIAPEAALTLQRARQVLTTGDEALAPNAALRLELHETLRSFGRAADSIRVLADYLDKHPESLVRGKSKDAP